MYVDVNVKLLVLDTVNRNFYPAQGTQRNECSIRNVRDERNTSLWIDVACFASFW